MKRLTSLILVAALSLPMFAQNEPQSDVPTLVETVNVRVISVDVVVTDKRGKPVTGLTSDDFEIFDNGRPQKITNFSEVIERRKPVTTATLTAPAPAPEPAKEPEAAEPESASQKRRFIFFIDNLSMAPFNRKPIFKEMKKFLDVNLLPGDLVMVATFNRDLKIRLPFTSDATAVRETLDMIEQESAMGLQRLSERRSVENQIEDAKEYELAVGAARGYAQSAMHDLRIATNSIKSLMTTVAGVEGKKVMILSSEGLPIQPGREVFQYIEELALRKRWTRAAPQMEAAFFNGTDLIQSIAQAANANNITLYTLHAGGLTGGDNATSAENRSPTPPLVQSAALNNSTESLRLLADMTGGRATTGTNNFAGAFKAIENDLTSYYSIGYSSATERVDRQRSLVVKARNRNYVVRSRRSFVEKSVATEITDKVVANLFHKTDSNDLKIFLTTRRPEPADGGLFRVPLEIHIPMELLTFLPQGEMLRGGFTVYVAAADVRGDMSDVQKQSHQLTLDPAEASKLTGKFYVYEVPLMMQQGRNKISVGVVDDITNTTGYQDHEVLARDLR